MAYSHRNDEMLIPSRIEEERVKTMLVRAPFLPEPDIVTNPRAENSSQESAQIWSGGFTSRIKISPETETETAVAARTEAPQTSAHPRRAVRLCIAAIKQRLLM